jgi:TRAP transporter 4TM/12TM fusion protein
MSHVNGPLWRTVTVVFTLLGLVTVMNQAFLWNPGGLSLLRNQFLYVVLACFLSLVFVVMPARKGSERTSVPWYDAVLFVVFVGLAAYFAYNGVNIATFGWDYAAPMTAVMASYAFWVLVLEALRRTAGLIVMIIAGVFSIYPIVAPGVPIGLLQGIGYSLDNTATIHAMGPDSILGLPLQVAAGMLVGFLLFGVVLQRTGGSEFFVDMSRSLLGHSRGGAAKVAVLSSASMGMMSGSAVSNVLTTGPMTIPAMKKTGFSGRYAAGIEATASTGGSITPPIMGAAAFLMVSFVGVPYSEVALAAAIPAVLYYLGIYTQVDAYAARAGLAGENRADLPKMGRVLAAGWPFLFALALLVFLLIWQRQEAQAPFYVVAAMLAIAALRRKDRLTVRGVVDMVVDTGRTVAEIIGIIAGVGLIVGGLSMTGVSLSLASELVRAVGGSVILILIAGALVCFVLGMGMTVSAVYVFLAIVMAPALVDLGVNEIAAHLFVIYWAAASYITPPVALAAFAAAGIAKTSPMATGFTAMRLGIAKYLVPFAFALNPALVAQGSLGAILAAFAFAAVGVTFVGAAMEGYVPRPQLRLPVWSRAILGSAGLLMLAPSTILWFVGLGVGVGLVALLWTTQRRHHETEEQPVATPVGSVADSRPGVLHARPGPRLRTRHTATGRVS